MASDRADIFHSCILWRKTFLRYQCQGQGQILRSQLSKDGCCGGICFTILTFNDPQERRLLKTLWDKEKMLVTSIFSFSHNIFYISKTEIIILATFILLSANAFNLVTSKILSFGRVNKHILFTKLCSSIYSFETFTESQAPAT